MLVSVFLGFLRAVHDADVEDFQRRNRLNQALQRNKEHDRLLKMRKRRARLLRKGKARKLPQPMVVRSPVKSLADLQHITSLDHLDLYGLPTGKRRRH
jgi:hypothetical protein